MTVRWAQADGGGQRRTEGPSVACLRTVSSRHTWCQFTNFLPFVLATYLSVFGVLHTRYCVVWGLLGCHIIHH